MYVETGFLLALVKDEDWLGDAAEAVYRERRDVERVVSNAASLVDVRGDADTVVAAATYVEDYGFTPFDAIHLVDPRATRSSPVTTRTSRTRHGSTCRPSRSTTSDGRPVRNH